MNTAATYLAGACAAWAGLGCLCLRSASVRGRLGWPRQGRLGNGVRAAGGTLFCILSLVLALRADAASFALTLWIAELGMLGLAMALLLAWQSQHLGASLWLTSAVALFTFASPFFAG